MTVLPVQPSLVKISQTNNYETGITHFVSFPLGKLIDLFEHQQRQYFALTMVVECLEYEKLSLFFTLQIFFIFTIDNHILSFPCHYFQAKRTRRRRLGYFPRCLTVISLFSKKTAKGLTKASLIPILSSLPSEYRNWSEVRSVCESRANLNMQLFLER